LKAKSKHWPNLKSILLGFDALLQVLVISLAHKNNATSPCGFGPSWMKPNWIFLSMPLVIGPLGGLWD